MLPLRGLACGLLRPSRRRLGTGVVRGGRAARSPGVLMGFSSLHVPAVVLAVHVEGLSSLVRLAIHLTAH